MLCRIFFQNKQKILKYNFIYSSVIKLTPNRKVECDKESATCTYLQDTQLIYQLFQKRLKKHCTISKRNICDIMIVFVL